MLGGVFGSPNKSPFMAPNPVSVSADGRELLCFRFSRGQFVYDHFTPTGTTFGFRFHWMPFLGTWVYCFIWQMATQLTGSTACTLIVPFSKQTILEVIYSYSTVNRIYIHRIHLFISCPHYMEECFFGAPWNKDVDSSGAAPVDAGCGRSSWHEFWEVFSSLLMHSMILPLPELPVIFNDICLMSHNYCSYLRKSEVHNLYTENDLFLNKIKYMCQIIHIQFVQNLQNTLDALNML